MKIKLIPYIVELLAKYCDHLLKKSSKNPEEAELEDTLNQVVSIKTFKKKLVLINWVLTINTSRKYNVLLITMLIDGCFQIH